MTKVGSIEILNDKDFLEFLTVGDTIAFQPKVKINDFDGNPLEGKQAILFSWVEPKYGAVEGTNAFLTNHKYCDIENGVSEESNSDGIAEFSNAKTKACKGFAVYFLVTVDGAHQSIYK